MSLIYQLPMQVPGMVGVLPNQKFMVTGDNLATITAAGYLNQVSLESNPISNTDVLQVLYSFNTATTVGTYGLFTVSINGTGTITLSQADLTGGVTLPTVANNLIVSTNTTGQLANVSGAAINNGIIQSGVIAGGSVGGFVAYPTTTLSGFIELLPVVNASGNFNTIISNAAAVAQSQTITIPDVGAATGQFLVKTAPFVTGNFPQNSGTAGLVIDSGFAVSNIVSKVAANIFSGAGQITLAKVNGTEAANAVTASGNAGFITTSALTTAAGSTYSITWTNTKITATSVIGLTIQGGTNTIMNVQFSCVAGSGSAALVINNIGPTNALNGTIIIGYSVL